MSRVVESVAPSVNGFNEHYSYAGKTTNIRGNLERILYLCHCQHLIRNYENNNEPYFVICAWIK